MGAALTVSAAGGTNKRKSYSLFIDNLNRREMGVEREDGRRLHKYQI